jgi:hypothetical protein
MDPFITGLMEHFSNNPSDNIASIINNAPDSTPGVSQNLTASFNEQNRFPIGGLFSPSASPSTSKSSPFSTALMGSIPGAISSVIGGAFSLGSAFIYKDAMNRRSDVENEMNKRNNQTSLLQLDFSKDTFSKQFGLAQQQFAFAREQFDTQVNFANREWNAAQQLGFASPSAMSSVSTLRSRSSGLTPNFSTSVAAKKFSIYG